MKQKLSGKIFLLIGLIIYSYQTMTNLVKAPLWFDEAVEFFYSRYMFGAIDGITTLPNMYERIISTFQPPLYNILMFFWLQINQSEQWFRLSGVLMGFIMLAGVYKSVKLISNECIAGITVIVSSCVYQFIYFSLECSEYILLLMNISWCFYFCIKGIKEEKNENIIFYLIFVILSVYSHYSAVFIAVPLTIGLFFCIIQKKLKRSYLLIGGAVATIVTGIPLISLFLLPQIRNINQIRENQYILTFENNNIFVDFSHNLSRVFRFCTIDSMTRFEWITAIVLIVVFVLYLLECIWIKNKTIILIVSTTISSFILYYIAVKSGIYAYGGFGNRYNLFLLPEIVLGIIILCQDVISAFIQKSDNKKYCPYLLYGMMGIIIIGFCVYGTHQINKGWDKLDCRGVVETWYENGGMSQLTYIDYNQNPGFTYYLRQNDSYKVSDEQNIVRDLELHYYCKEQKREYVLQQIGDLPDSFYLAGSAELAEIFAEEGYNVITLYQTTANLYYMEK